MVTDITPAEIGQQCDALEAALTRLDVDALSGARASQVLRRVARTRSACAALEGRLARRGERTGIWRQGGHKSPAHFLAATTGTSIGAATIELETAERLESLPHAAEAFNAGRISPGQVTEIARAAVAVPEAEHDLLLAARTETFSHLRDHCRQVKAAVTDQSALHRRIHESRSVHTWTDAEGAWNLQARGTVTDGGRILAALKAETDSVFTEARIEGRREPHEAYVFDALVRLADRDGASARSKGPKTHVHVNVDVEPLLAAQAMPGKTCEIPGLGPIPIEAAAAYLGDALLTVVLKKGVDVLAIAHHKRTIPTAVRRTLHARDLECVNAACSARDHLEAHHLFGWVNTHTTTVEDVVLICGWDHYLVTHCGYTLQPRGDGTYDLIAPDEERGPP